MAKTALRYDYTLDTSYLSDPFYKDTIKLFSGSDSVDLAPYFYSSPLFENDVVRGAELASKIWDSKTYYLRNAEAEILEQNSDQIAQLIGNDADIIEFGPGPSESVRLKTMALMRKMASIRSYTALDLSRGYLNDAKRMIKADFPHIPVKLHQSDFYEFKIRTQSLHNPLLVFFGNTIANIPEDADGALPYNTLKALRKIRNNFGESGLMVIGHDANQNIDSIFSAYGQKDYTNYAMNVFHRIKRDLPTQRFDPEGFESKIEWIQSYYCLTRYAVSKRDQSFMIGDRNFTLSKGQKIRFCNTYKYPAELMADLAGLAGFEHLQVFTDSKKQMAVHILKPSKSNNLLPLSAA